MCGVWGQNLPESGLVSHRGRAMSGGSRGVPWAPVGLGGLGFIRGGGACRLVWRRLREGAFRRSLRGASPAAGFAGGSVPSVGEKTDAGVASAHQVAVHLSGVDAQDHA